MLESLTDKQKEILKIIYDKEGLKGTGEEFYLSRIDRTVHRTAPAYTFTGKGYYMVRRTCNGTVVVSDKLNGRTVNSLIGKGLLKPHRARNSYIIDRNKLT